MSAQTELPEIAKSVAGALGLVHAIQSDAGWYDEKERLYQDGSNVFSEHWFHRCVGWLLERGYFETVKRDVVAFLYWQEGHGQQTRLVVECPWQEFPARCLHELMRKKNG